MRSHVWVAVALGASLLACRKAPPPAPTGPTTEGINAAVTAKLLCSGVFVAHRDPDEIVKDDLHVEPAQVLGNGMAKIRQDPPAVIVGPAEAVYRPGLGCTLLNGRPEADVYKQFAEPPAPPAAPSAAAWPDGDGAPAPLPKEVDAAALDAAMAYAFSEPAAQADMRGTRAVTVIHGGKLLAEKYAAPFSAATPLVGYSMTKSIINTLTGVLVQEGKISVAKPPQVPEWPEGDPRRAITLDQMLHMSSGLQFDEVYSIKPVDVVVMLYAAPDSAHLAADKPLINPPGAVWAYASGTTNLIARALQPAVGGTLTDYLKYPAAHLFKRIGATSAVFEPDAAGTFVGSTFMYATARDWAKLGALYLNDGMWKGERILPEGWVKYSVTPAEHAPEGRYGAHLWLNAGDPADPSKRAWPNVPPDMYAFIGYLGQAVVIIPSRDVVIVRLGETMPDPPDPGKGDSNAFSLDQFVSMVVKALPPEKPTAKPRK